MWAVRDIKERSAMRWPPPWTSLPTIAAITATKLPAGRVIDGMDISALLNGAQKLCARNFSTDKVLN